MSNFTPGDPTDPAGPASTLSKREYFAGQALQGYCASATADMTATQLAGWAVETADALIEELNEVQP